MVCHAAVAAVQHELVYALMNNDKWPTDGLFMIWRTVVTPQTPPWPPPPAPPPMILPTPNGNTRYEPFWFILYIYNIISFIYIYIRQFLRVFLCASHTAHASLVFVWKYTHGTDFFNFLHAHTRWHFFCSIFAYLILLNFYIYYKNWGRYAKIEQKKCDE